MPCNDCLRALGPSSDAAFVDRRGFVTRLGLAAVAAMLAACGDGQIGAGGVTGLGGGTAADLIVDPNAFAALGTVGGIARVDPAGGAWGPVAVVRTGTATWSAFSLVCPHQGTTVNVVGTTGFTCPNHGARFSPAGANIGGQTSGPLLSLAIVQRADGMLVISGAGGGGGTGGGGDDDGDDR